MIAANRLVALLLLISAMQAFSAENDPRSSSEFYRSAFGQVTPLQFPLAFRVSRIFLRLLRVVDKAEYKDPQILIVDSDNWPWAIALPDNTIVLSRGAVELCYADVEVELGDTRLAMILGHELGHLAEDDYWHRDVYLSLNEGAISDSADVLGFIGERSGLIDTQSEQWQKIVRDRELKADDRGFIYSALAGFEPLLLVEEPGQDFFDYWVSQTTGRAGIEQNRDKSHLTPQDRAVYLKARIGALKDLPLLYRLGIALAYLNRLEVAELFFRKVLVAFPSHEVYNNLGVIKLLTASRLESPDNDGAYWLPVMLDLVPESPILKRGVDNKNARQDANQLKQAAEYFEQAIKQKPAYLQAYINLVTTSFYQKKYTKALSIVDEALELFPDSSELKSLRQLAMLESTAGSFEYLPFAIRELELLRKNENVSSALYFNLAQLYEQSGQHEKAVSYWQKVNEIGPHIPVPLKPVIEGKLQQSMQERAQNSSQNLEAYLMTMLKNNASLSLAASEQAVSSGPVVNNKMLLKTHLSPNATEYSLGGKKLLRVYETDENPVQELLLCCGEPRSKAITSIGEVWVYGDEWALLVEANKIKQIWQKI